MKRSSLTVMTALVLTLAAGCGSDDSAPDDEGGTGPIIIGAAVAESGGFELYDNAQTSGMQYAIDEINEAGGVNGRKFELITADHKTDPAQVQAVTQELLDEGADVIVTTVDYDFGAQAAIAASKAGKVSISGAGAPEFGFRGLGPLHFNVYQGTPSESAALAEFAYTTQGLRHPYLLEDTSIQYSKSLCAEFEAAWEKVAGADSIAGKDSFVNSDPSIANQVTQIKAATDTDFVVLCSYPPGGASAIRQLRTAGADLPIYGGSAFDGTFWTDAVPDLSNFFHVAMASSAGDDPNPELNAFLESVEYEGSASYALFGYENIQTIAAGFEESGSMEGSELAKGIETLQDADFLVGKTTYSADCHAPVDRPMAIVNIEHGEAKLAQYVEVDEVPRTAC
jgi:branched-chain amino acid transport system substrate-binding protein